MLDHNSNVDYVAMKMSQNYDSRKLKSGYYSYFNLYTTVVLHLKNKLLAIFKQIGNMIGFFEQKAIVNKKYQEKKRREKNEPSFEDKIKQEIKKLEEDSKIKRNKVKQKNIF